MHMTFRSVVTLVESQGGIGCYIRAHKQFTRVAEAVCEWFRTIWATSRPCLQMERASSHTRTRREFIKMTFYWGLWPSIWYTQVIRLALPSMQILENATRKTPTLYSLRRHCWNYHTPMLIPQLAINAMQS